MSAQAYRWTTGRSFQIGLLSFVVLLSMSVWFSASAVVPQLTLEWGLGPSMQAWMTMAVQLGFVVGALMSAIWNLSDRIPAPRLVMWSALLGAICTALIAWQVNTAIQAIPLRFVTGVAMAGVYPPAMKIVASWSTHDRGLFIGLLVGAVTLGSGLPHLLNALSDSGLGVPPWQQVLWGSAFLSLAAAALAGGRLQMGPHAVPAGHFHWRYALQGFTRRKARVANVGYFGHMWELYAVWTWVPVMLLASFALHGWPEWAARLVAFGMFAVGSVACLAAGWLADRIGRLRVTSVSLTVSGCCCLMVGFVFNHPLLLTILCLVWGFFVIADSAQFSAMVSEETDAAYMGTALQVQTSIGFLITLVSLQLIPVLTDVIGYRYSFMILALGPAVALGHALVHTAVITKAPQMDGLDNAVDS